MRSGIAIVLLLMAPVLAQGALIPTRGEQIQLTANPTHPVPNTSVTITAHVSLESLGKTMIWTVDGDYITEGVGLTTITIPIGAVGTATEVEATLMEEGEIRGSARYIVRPTEVDLVWEGQTYVPPLYAGRPLANANADVVVVAFPKIIRSGVAVPSTDLNFTWDINGTVQQSQSGYGKATFTTRPTRYSDALTVGVTVETRDGLYRARGATAINPVRPFAVVYEDRPLTGINFYRSATRGALLGGDEITFRVYPYFSAVEQELTFAWSFNGQPISFDSDDPRTATFRRTGEGVGTFSVEVSFENLKLLFERGRGAFNLSL